MISLKILIAGAILFSRPCAGQAFDSIAFSPDAWPGRTPEAVAARLLPLSQQLLKAMISHDPAAFDVTKEKIVQVLGIYAGVPEERPTYGKPIVTSTPDFDVVRALWTTALDAQTGRLGWEQAALLQESPGAGGKVPRLRISQRQIAALLRSYEANLPGKEAYLEKAVAGLNYLLTTQATTGVFGYPYEPGGSGLRSEAAGVVQRGEKQGIKMVERQWVIEDLGDGGLNFDNGMCGATFLHGYQLTGDVRYLDAAKRAGAWAKTRKLALNFNYNGFSGVLLARLYRTTRDPQWLEAAKPVFNFGVIRGQMPNGRWFDQHNAKIQYHSILCWQMSEFLLALLAAHDPLAPEVKSHLRAGLDNLAAELLCYGTNNAEEALSIEALCIGIAAAGPSELWSRALNVVVNYVTGPFVDRARERGGYLPEPVSMWLLMPSHSSQVTKSVEGTP